MTARVILLSIRSELVKHLLTGSIIFSLISGELVSQAQAVAEQTPKQIGHFGQWTAYVMKENNKKVCYMASLPTASKGNYKKRDQVYAVVTHRPDEKKYNAVSFHAGYTFAPGAEVQVQVGEKKFILFTQGNTAWATDEQDQDLVSEIAKAGTLTVTGTSSRGTKTEDTYSLTGSSRALAAINQTCGLKSGQPH